MKIKLCFYIIIFFIILFINASSLNDKFLDAVNNQDIELVKKYIKRRVNVNSVASNNWTPLIIAIDKNNPELVKILIEAGAETNIEIPLYNTDPLFYAMCYKKSPEIVEILLNTNTYKKSINDFYSKYQKTTPLMYAVKNYDLEILKLILANEADPDLAGEYGYTPLILAIQSQKAELVLELLKTGANPNKKDTNRGYTPLVWAISETPHKGTENLEIMKILLDEGADINAKNDDGSTLLSFSSAHGRLELIQFLINNGADVNAGSGDKVPIFRAIYNNDPNVIKALINAGAEIDRIDSTGETPLFYTIFNDVNPDIIKELVKAGANINHKNLNNETPITLAQKKGKKDIVALLKNTKLEKKIKPKSKDEIRIDALLVMFPIINDSWSKEEIKKADTAKGYDYLSNDEKNIILFINLVRMDGNKFSNSLLEEWVKMYKLDKTGATEAGQYVKSLYDDLKEIKNLPLLIPSKNLYNAAYYHAKDMGKTGQKGHFSSNGTPYEERILKFGNYKKAAENCYYGLISPYLITMTLLIDYKEPTLGHRKTILNKYYKYIGVSIQPHNSSFSFNCVQEFAENEK